MLSTGCQKAPLSSCQQVKIDLIPRDISVSIASMASETLALGKYDSW